MNKKLSKLHLLTPLENNNNNTGVDKKKLKVVQENLNLSNNSKTSVNYGFIEFSKTNGIKVVDVKCSPNGYDLSELGQIFRFTFKENSLEIINIENFLSNFSLLES